MAISKKAVFANIVLASGIVLCLLFAAAAFRKNSDYYLYVTPLAASVFLGFCLRLKTESKVNLSLVFLSLGISICCAELFLAARSIRKICSLDVRSKLSVILDLRNKGLDACPAFNPLVWSHDGQIDFFDSKGRAVLPLVQGVPGKIHVACKEGRKDWLTYTVDRYGFRNPDEIYEKGSFDLMTIGDSFTQGNCVEYQDSIAGQLRKITGKNVVNLGFNGASPLTELAILSEYGEILRPKKVLWFFFEGNDLADIKRDRAHPILLKYLNNDKSPFNFQDLAARQPELNGIIEKRIEDIVKQKRKETSILVQAQEAKEAEDSLMIIRKKQVAKTLRSIPKLSHLRELFGLVSKEVKVGDASDHNDYEKSKDQIPMFLKIIEKAQIIVKSWGGELIFVVLPAHERYYYNADYNSKEISSVLKGLKIPVVNIDQAFSKLKFPRKLFNGDPHYFMGKHYTREGYRIVAEAVASFLRQKEPGALSSNKL